MFEAMTTDRAGIGPGIPTFFLAAGPRLATRHLADARLDSWCYPIVAGHSAAVVALGIEGSSLLFRDLSAGAYARRLVEAIAFVEKTSVRSKAAFDLRILDCPALHLSYLWLNRRGRNLFVDLLPQTQEADAPLEIVASIRHRVRDEYFARADAHRQGPATEAAK